MAASKELIEEKMKETDLNKNIPIENVDIKKEELSVEGVI